MDPFEKLSKLLVKEHSKKQMLKTVVCVEKEHALFDPLMQIALGKNPLFIQRSSWAIRTIVEKSPKLLDPYLADIIKRLESTNHPAFKRNFLALFSVRTFPEKYEGKIATLCFKILQNSAEPIAVHVFAMSTLHQLCKKYPELKQELVETLKLKLQEGSPGYVSRAKKIIQDLKRPTH